jgi:hypothetical protein
MLLKDEAAKAAGMLLRVVRVGRVVLEVTVVLNRGVQTC